MSAFSAAVPVEAPFELAPGAHLLFTSRASENLSSRSGERREHAAEARERLRGRLELHALAHARQVHGVTVRRLSEERAPAQVVGDDEADGHTSDLAGLGLLVFTADCLPVALACDGAVAMLHAGWRGLAAGVLEQGVRALREVGRRERAGGGDRAGCGRLLLRGRGGGARGVRGRASGGPRARPEGDRARSPARRRRARGARCRDLHDLRPSASSRTGAKVRARAARRGWRGWPDLRRRCRAGAREPRGGARQVAAAASRAGRDPAQVEMLAATKYVGAEELPKLAGRASRWSERTARRSWTPR